jgi:protein NRD1
MLNDFKERLNTSMQRKTHCTLPRHQHDVFLRSFESNPSGFYVDESTTPPGSPPADLQRTFGAQPAAPAPPAPAPATATSAPSILEALANLARQQAPAPAPAPAQHHAHAQDNSYNVSNAHNNPAQPASALNQAIPFPAVPPQPVNVPATFASQPQGSSNGAQNYGSNQTIPNPFAAVPPVVPGVLDPTMQQQLLLVKALADQGLPPDQIQGILARMGQGLPMLGAGGVPPPPPQFAAQQQQQLQNPNQNQNAQNGWPPNGASRPDDSRDHNGYHDREAVRSPTNRYRQRSRSRSPSRAWNARDSPASRRRDEPNTFDYERNSPARNRGEDRGRGGRGGRGNDYRQRSPPRRGRSPTPPRSRGGGGGGGGGGQKWIDHDSSIGKGNIKGKARPFAAFREVTLTRL